MTYHNHYFLFSIFCLATPSISAMSKRARKPTQPKRLEAYDYAANQARIAQPPITKEKAIEQDLKNTADAIKIIFAEIKKIEFLQKQQLAAQIIEQKAKESAQNASLFLQAQLAAQRSPIPHQQTKRERPPKTKKRKQS